MEKTLNKIINGAKKGLVTLLAPALIGIGCSNIRDTPSKSIPLCTGGDLRYKNLEVLAQANEGQKLMKIDGKFYVEDEDCSIDYYRLNGVKSVNYSLEGNKKVLTIIYENGNIFRNVWEKDGTFYKVIEVN